MANLNGYNANDYDPQDSFDPLPADKYTVAITASEMRQAKSGAGSYLWLELAVTDGEYQGRKLWDQLCINHSSKQAQEIARKKLSAICHAVGVLQPRDSVELHNLPLVAKVSVRPREDTGELSNTIKGYSKRESTVNRPPAGPAGAPQGQPAAAGNSTAPWKR